jgi:hypothetical protein
VVAERPEPDRQGPVVLSRAIVILGFGALGLAMLVADMRGHLARSRLVPVAMLLQVVLARRSSRLVILLFWWWIGWHFLVEPP